MDVRSFFMPQNGLLFVGTYTRSVGHAPGANGQGIYTYRLDTRTGELTFLHVTGGIDNPSFLSIDPQKRFLYATSEVEEWQEGLLNAYAINAETGALTYINKQPTLGSITAYTSVDPAGRCVFASNYGGGMAAVVFPMREDGGLSPASGAVAHAGSGPVTARQEGPHPHCIVPAPTGVYVYVADLGIDKVMIYRLENGRLIPNSVPSFNLPPSSGPRHLVFHPNRRFAYVIAELSSTITALKFDESTGALEALQTVSTLPDDFAGESTCSEIQITPDGRFLYGGNRGHDSLAIFAVDSVTGTLTPVGHQSTKGRTPRNFTVDPTGAFVLVGNQDSDTVVSFRIDPATGLLADTGYVTRVPAPACLRMILA